jgi:hypothetical protein
MVFEELESYIKSTGLLVQDLILGEEEWIIVGGIQLTAGPHAGTVCEVAIPRSKAVPWAPEAKIHVRPHLVPMDAAKYASRPSSVGDDWQYLSRRFDPVPTPAGYMAFVLSALEEL